MRIAVVSDIHGNRTAFDALLKDLRDVSPDLIVHGGDLADFGSSPSEIIDQIRDLGWDGVLGNTDEMHTRPESLEEFAANSAAPAPIWAAIRDMRTAVCEQLGTERISWLATLPRLYTLGSLAVVHASPHSAWQSPHFKTDDSELVATYAHLQRDTVVYGHIHESFIRKLPNSNIVIINRGSVGLPYDRDPRAAYLLLDDFEPEIRRIEYSLDKELRAIKQSRLPHTDWIRRTLCTASPQMP